jgi:hypothetical protein
MPGPTAQVPAGQDKTAKAQASGVQVAVTTESWKGRPSDLPRVLTPVRVTIQNRSGHPIRLRYQDFALVGSSGFTYVSIPPLEARGNQVSEAPSAATPSTRRVSTQAPPQPVTPPARQAVRPQFVHQGFYVSPWYSYNYPGLGVWPGYFPWDPYYYDRYYAVWPEPLPTRDMIERALPEGVLQNGGTISGYLYFNDVERENSVAFRFPVVAADTNQVLGTATIPFEVER